jgi:hypothetical protein
VLCLLAPIARGWIALAHLCHATRRCRTPKE